MIKLKDKLPVLLIAFACTWFSCENKDAERGQFNNNSTGADRDHTTVAKDTISTSGLGTDSSFASPGGLGGGTPTQ